MGFLVDRSEFEQGILGLRLNGLTSQSVKIFCQGKLNIWERNGPHLFGIEGQSVSDRAEVGTR